jgi:hypothetical protein
MDEVCHYEHYSVKSTLDANAQKHYADRVPESSKRAQAPKRSRFNAYLTAAQIEWINKMRGQYMGETGKNMTTTAFLRALVTHTQGLSWKEIRALLEERGQADS